MHYKHAYWLRQQWQLHDLWDLPEDWEVPDELDYNSNAPPGSKSKAGREPPKRKPAFGAKGKREQLTSGSRKKPT